MALEQETVHPHYPIDTLHVRRGTAVLLSLAAQQGMDATVAIGRQVGDQGPDFGDKLLIGRRRATSPTRHSLAPSRKVGA